MAPHTGWMTIRNLTIAAAALSLFACNGDYSTNGSTLNADATNTGTGSTTSTGVGNNAGITCGANDFCVNVVPPNNTTMVLHQDGNYSQPCKATAGTDVACVLDADEFDLYASGTTLNYNVPSGMCSYMYMQPYFYYQYQPGIGPSQVTINVSSTGTITESDSGDGIPNNSNANYNRTVVVGPPYSAKPVCSTDYSSRGGPNCCGGSYTLNVITTTTSNGNPTSTTVTTSQSWGGNPNNCLVGPGVDSQPHFNGAANDPRNGYPEATLYYLENGSINKTYSIKSPLTKQFNSNAYVANYWQSGLVGDYPLTNDGSANGSPNAIQGPSLTAGDVLAGCVNGQLCSGNPWYEFECMDAADDHIASIKVMVRSWTSNVNFQSFITNQTDVPANGTYNLFGNEPAPFGQYAIEDFETWVTPFSPSLGTGAAGTLNSACYNGGLPSQDDCGFGSMYPGIGN